MKSFPVKDFSSEDSMFSLLRSIKLTMIEHVVKIEPTIKKAICAELDKPIKILKYPASMASSILGRISLLMRMLKVLGEQKYISFDPEDSDFSLDEWENSIEDTDVQDMQNVSLGYSLVSPICNYLHTLVNRLPMYFQIRSQAIKHIFHSLNALGETIIFKNGHYYWTHFNLDVTQEVLNSGYEPKDIIGSNLFIGSILEAKIQPLWIEFPLSPLACAILDYIVTIPENLGNRMSGSAKEALKKKEVIGEIIKYLTPKMESIIVSNSPSNEDIIELCEFYLNLEASDPHIIHTLLGNSNIENLEDWPSIIRRIQTT